MNKRILCLCILYLCFIPLSLPADGERNSSMELATPKPSGFTLMTATPEAGFQLAIRLSRLGVTKTQPDKSVLFAQRKEYAEDADALIAASQVIALHFQTIAAANDYWRSPAAPEVCTCP